MKCKCGKIGRFYDITGNTFMIGNTTYLHSVNISVKFCIDCKKDGMRSKCKVRGCNKIATHGEEFSPNVCFEHSVEQKSLCNICYKFGDSKNNMEEYFCNTCKESARGFCSLCKKGCGKFILKKFYKDCKERSNADQVCEECVVGNLYEPIFMECQISGKEFCQRHRCQCGKAYKTWGLLYERATCCAECKLPDMIEIKPAHCTYDKCNELATHGTLVNTPVPLRNLMRLCAAHMEKGMFNLSKYGCLMAGCEKDARWGYAGKVRDRLPNQAEWVEDEYVSIFCQDHRKEDMIPPASYANMCCGPTDISKRGPNGKCPYTSLGKDKYRKDGKRFCAECFLISFPTDPLVFDIKTKNRESRVMKRLVTEFPEYGFIHDKPMWTGNCDCSHRRRIDLRTLIGNTILAVEVDEEQHKQYEAGYEELRYDDLYMIFSGKWVFVRFNPDSYKNKKGSIVKTTMKEKIEVLCEFIKMQIQRIKSEENTELLEIHKLYYDNYT